MQKKSSETIGEDFIFGYDYDLRKGYVKSLDGVLIKEWDGLAPTGYFEPWDFLFCNGLAVLSDRYFKNYEDDWTYYLLDPNFNILPNGPLSWVSWEWFRPYLGAGVKNRSGFLDGSGNWKVPPIYEDVVGDEDYPQWPFVFVKKDGLWGVLGPYLEEILPCKFVEIKLVELNDHVSWSGTEGTISDPEGDFDCLCRVKGTNGKYGILSFCKEREESFSRMAFSGCNYDSFYPGEELDLDEIDYLKNGEWVQLQGGAGCNIEEWAGEHFREKLIWEMEPVKR